MTRGDAISDELWGLIEPVLPSNAGRKGHPWGDHRLALEGIAWRLRTGAPWRDVPGCFGAWQTIWERHRRWSTDGTYARIFAVVRGHAGAGDLTAVLSVDSTSIRAHQHAAGAPSHSLRGGTIELQELRV
jgi:transposase